MFLTKNRDTHSFDRSFRTRGRAKRTGDFRLLAEKGVLTTAATERWDSFLDKAYPDSLLPRRIAEETALVSAAIAAIMCPNIIHAPSPENPTQAFIDEQSWWHVPESEETLTIASVKLSSNTWISSPPRAVIECFENPAMPDTPTSLLKFLQSAAFKPEEILEISEVLGMQHGIRRMCSTVYVLDGKNGYSSPAWMKKLATTAAVDTSENIYLYGKFPEQSIYHYDRVWNVTWDIEPVEVIARTRT